MTSAWCADKNSCVLTMCYQTVSPFTKEVNLRLAKRPLKTNVRLANIELTSIVKEGKGVNQGVKCMTVICRYDCFILTSQRATCTSTWSGLACVLPVRWYCYLMFTTRYRQLRERSTLLPFFVSAFRQDTSFLITRVCGTQNLFLTLSLFREFL